MQFDISVVIVNYKTTDVIHDCLQSLFMQEGLKLEIIVVDNASTSETQHALAKYKNRITTIFNEDNNGFGQACNQGVKLSRGKYIYLLNPDTILLKSDSLKQLIHYAESNSQFGLIGTKLVDLDGKEEEYVSHTYPGQNHVKYDFSQLPGHISYLHCASVIMPRDIFDLVNGFDEDFFVYGEDLDLCLRLRQKGYAIGYLEDLAVQHLGNASERKSSHYAYFYRLKKALYTFFYKHYTENEVKKLLSKEKYKAHWRLFTLRLRNLFSTSEKIKCKIAEYLATLDVLKKQKFM